MRTASLAVIALSVFSVSACKDTSSTIDQDLRADLALAASGERLDLAPAAGSRGTVSALEQVQQQTVARPMPSRREATYRPASTAQPQAPKAPKAPIEATPEAPAEISVPEPEAVITAVPEVASGPSPSPEPQVAEQPAIDAAPAPMPSARPQPVEINPPERSNVGTATRGPIGVVIRGGTVDGDHCDPRVDGRRRGGGQIAVNNRIPRRF